ncbi:uncharacterized protein LOC121390577 [Gigantopelta aegis]|uniref:uncharacterized protein LOC121390577 n=1 Tax=Gigantopelta aegis TaxID=1735272 RepID=UPI001B88C1CE|nr:uncharacterized protein LOC121390577 [Gigantopelta aegis]
MQLSTQPQPLTRLNVTKHDRIWNKELSDGFYGLNINKNSLFSPPLKHITPEIIEELWEKFDPLDLLIDLGSDKSGSSSDTMIMMTTEEERKNEESIKNSFLAFELRKHSKHPFSQEYSVQSGNHSNYEQCTAGEFRSGQCLDYDVNVDEGYGTDSRTNTTASLASPLSSSLSSLLTSESSSSQGSLKKNTSHVMNLNSRPQQIQGSGRLVVGNKPAMVAKKKAQPVEKSDNSLMERLRALTTIQEEESSSSAAVDQDWNNTRNSSAGSCAGSKYSADQCFNSIQDGNNFQGMGQGYVREGVFRAKPIHVSSDVGNRQILDNRISNGNNRSWNSSDNVSDDNYFSESSYPLVNGIDRDQRSENVSGGHRGILRNGNSRSETSQRCLPHDVSSIQQDLRQKPSRMISMPNLNAPFDQAGNHFENGVDTSHVQMRPKPSGMCAPARRSQRHSWDYCDVNSLKGKFSDTDNHNLSERIPEPPKLSNQIRASSEMSLKSGRPLFAASTDIYRLFQGQSHPGGFSQVKSASHRHSFHAMPSQSWQPNVSVSEVKSRLRVASFGMQLNRPNGPVPVKGNHDIYNHVSESCLPWEMASGSKSSDQFKHRSLSDDKDKLSTLV